MFRRKPEPPPPTPLRSQPGPRDWKPIEAWYDPWTRKGPGTTNGKDPHQTTKKLIIAGLILAGLVRIGNARTAQRMTEAPARQAEITTDTADTTVTTVIVGQAPPTQEELAAQRKAEAAAREAEIAKDVTIIECGVDDGLFKDMVATVEILNGSAERSSYYVTVSFESADGAVQYATGFGGVSSLNPGQRAVEEVSTFTDPVPGFVCTVADVTRHTDEPVIIEMPELPEPPSLGATAG